jgi:hypothetical protein
LSELSIPLPPLPEQRRIAEILDKARMAKCLTDELSVEPSEALTNGSDDTFDAGLAALAALRGLNREWTLDLHAPVSGDRDFRVRFCGPTHFWWPSGVGPGGKGGTHST